MTHCGLFIISLSLQVLCNIHEKFGEYWMCSSEDMIADRQMHAD